MHSIGSILADILTGISEAEGLDPKEISAVIKFLAVGIDPDKESCGFAIVDPRSDPKTYLNPVKEFTITASGFSFSISFAVAAHQILFCRIDLAFAGR